MGLPVGQRPAAVLFGPGLHRRLSAAQLTLRHARPGWYTLTVGQVTLTHGHGWVLMGATADPVTRRVKVRLRAGKSSSLTGTYGTIVNPGLRSVHAPVLGVTGPPAHPRSVRLRGRPGLAAGQVLSLAPRAALPEGVLARVLSATVEGNATVVTLGPVSVFDVVPVAHFDVPVHIGAAGGGAGDATARSAAATAGCGPSVGLSDGVYRTFKNAQFSGGWNTVSVLGHKVPVGLTAGLDVDLTAGVQDQAGVTIGASCEVDIPWQAMAGPVPVTGSVFGNVHGSVGGGVGFDAQLSVHVHAGVSTVGVPPDVLFVPQVRFSHPSADVYAAGEVAVTAGFGAGVKFGLGSEWGADATVNIENDWDFTAQASFPDGGGCTTQAKFASVDAEAKLGIWTVQTPSTPPLFTETLWGPTSCEPTPAGSTGGGAGGGAGGGGGTGGTGGGSSTFTHVTPLGPTSGPSGFGLQVGLPACPSGNIIVLADGQQQVLEYGGIVESRMYSLYPLQLSPGTHQLSFSCVSGWTDPGFAVHVTGPAIPQSLQSDTVAPGSNLVVYSGASDSPSPCPMLTGYPVYKVLFALWDAEGHATDYSFPLPDDATSMTLAVPSSLAPGNYTLWETCLYGSQLWNDGGSGALSSQGFFDYVDQPLTVS